MPVRLHAQNEKRWKSIIPAYRHVPSNGQMPKTGGYVPCEPENRGYVPGGKSANRQNRGFVPDRVFANRREG